MIYLDNSATTRPFESVIAEMDRCMRDDYYNVSAAYAPAMLAEKNVEAARGQILKQLGLPRGQLFFTGGGSESDNLGILGFAETLHEPGTFLVSQMEHPAVLETLKRVQRQGHTVRMMPIARDGRIDTAAALELVDEKTVMLLCMHVNNETGAIQPIGELSKGAKAIRPGLVVLSDGVQGFMRVPMNMRETGVDLYALSAHKIHGPKGVGALAAAPEIRLVPQITGGGQEAGVRSGTLNSPGIRGLGTAVERCSDECVMDTVYALKSRLVGLLKAEDGIAFNGPDPLDREVSAPHILSARFEGVRGEVMRNALEAKGILVSTGSACGSHKQKVSATLKAMGLGSDAADGTIRVSIGAMNTMDEMDTAAGAMIEAAKMLRQFRRR
ncbi:MAG: cysteine desulfurase [Clostridia bacterium]|nr:cysteine desulfurase [Clostridia bacterium]